MPADIAGVAGLWPQLDEGRRKRVLASLSEQEKQVLLGALTGRQQNANKAPTEKGGFFSGLGEMTLDPLIEMGKAHNANVEATRQQIADTPGFLGKAGVKGGVKIDRCGAVKLDQLGVERQRRNRAAEGRGGVFSWGSCGPAGT